MLANGVIVVDGTKVDQGLIKSKVLSTSLNREGGTKEVVEMEGGAKVAVIIRISPSKGGGTKEV